MAVFVLSDECIFYFYSFFSTSYFVSFHLLQKYTFYFILCSLAFATLFIGRRTGVCYCLFHFFVFIFMSFLLGRKMKMTQLWQGQTVVPVTAVRATGNVISLIRTAQKDGYSAVQVATGKTKREFRTNSADANVGDAINVSSFQEGDLVHIIGITKGRGFQGVVKRHGFGGGPKTHGQKNRYRAPGSIGSTAPQRVVPGRRMAGHMGVDRVTIKNLTVAKVDADHDTIFIKGAVPGAIGGLLEIRKA